MVIVVKNPSAKAGDGGDADWIPGWERSPGGGHGNPLQFSCLENPHGQRSLADYRLWYHKKSDMTEPLSTHTGWRYQTQGYTSTGFHQFDFGGFFLFLPLMKSFGFEGENNNFSAVTQSTFL